MYDRKIGDFYSKKNPKNKKKHFRFGNLLHSNCTLDACAETVYVHPTVQVFFHFEMPGEETIMFL